MRKYYSFLIAMLVSGSISSQCTVFGVNYIWPDTNNVNESGLGYIAYCFHSISGYSKFGSYAGNGSTNAITTGFKFAFSSTSSFHLSGTISNSMDIIFLTKA